MFEHLQHLLHVWKAINCQVSATIELTLPPLSKCQVSYFEISAEYEYESFVITLLFFLSKGHITYSILFRLLQKFETSKFLFCFEKAKHFFPITTIS